MAKTAIPLSPEQSRAGAAPGGVNERLLLLAVGLGTLTGPWNFTMLIVALPNLADDLGVSLATTSWVIVIPMITSSSLQSVAGRLADMIGYRKVFIASLAAYSLATFAAAFAPSFWALVMLRMLQVTAGSATFPAGNALIRVNMPEGRRAAAFGAIGSAISFAITAGPFIGGALVGAFGWRAIFIANLPFTLAGVLVALAAVPPDPDESRASRSRNLDPFGIILLASSIIAVVLPMLLARDGFISLSLLPPVYAGAAGLVALFVWWEWRQANPIIQVRLYLTRSFRAAAVGDSFMNAAGFPLTVVASIFLQTYQDRSALETGVVIALGTVGMAILAPFGGRLADRFGRRIPIIAGRVVMVTGLILLLAIISRDLSPWLFALGMALVSGGNGIAMPPGQTAAIESAPRRYSGMAAGVAATTAFMGGILGITWSTLYLGEDPTLAQFRLVLAVFLAAALIAILIGTRVARWPAEEGREE